MGSWRVAKSLLVLRDQIDAAHPGRAKGADGTIGDAAHQAGTSDHNPRIISGLGGTPVVTALDITQDPPRCDCGPIVEALRQSKDNRIKYVIWSGRMFSSYTSGGVPAWTWRGYSGSDPHRNHFHVSVVGDARADGAQPWRIGTQSNAQTTGGTMAISDQEQRDQLEITYMLASGEDPRPSDRFKFRNPFKALERQIADLAGKPTATVDPAALATALAGNTAFVNALAAAVAQQVGTRLTNG